MSDITDAILSTDQTAFRPARFGASCNLLNTLSKFTHNSKLPAIHLKMSGNLFAACRSVSVGMWVSLGAGIAGGLRVKSGARQFEFRYTAPNLAGDGKLRFRYRLEGSDPSWEDAGEQRVAHYNHLTPGHYEFRVMAGGADGVWRESAQGLKLEIVPRLWERRSVQVAGAVLALLGVAAGVLLWERARTRRKLLVLQTQQALEQERRRLAQDLHDDIGASVAKLMMLGEMAVQHSCKSSSSGAYRYAVPVP